MNDIEQAEALKAWWKKYGNYLLLLIAIVALAIGGTKFWQNHQQNIRNKASVAYSAMIDSIAHKDTQTAQAQAKLLIQQYNATGYASFAHLYLAKVAAEQQQYAQATAQLNQVIQAHDNDNLATFAKLMLARVDIANQQPDQALQTLNTLTAHDGFAAMKQMLIGQAYQVKSDYAQAKTHYELGLKASQGTPLQDYIQTLMSGLPA